LDKFMKNIPALPDWFANVLLASNSNQNLRDGNDFMSPGIRNADLASVAGFLRRKFALGGDELEDALSALNNTAHQPLPSTEVSQIANSISRYHASPVTDFTDTGLSRVFAKQICDVFKFVEGMGWMNYREGHWQPDNENLEIQETAKEFATRIHSHFEGCGTNDRRWSLRFFILGGGGFPFENPLESRHTLSVLFQRATLSISHLQRRSALPPLRWHFINILPAKNGYCLRHI
jgi:hypothetical protein